MALHGCGFSHNSENAHVQSRSELIVLKNFARFQEMNMEKVRLGQKANLAAMELAQIIIALLDQLILDCK